MKKNLFLKFFLFAVVASLVTFTSCKDYDDDIDNLNAKIEKTLPELKSEVEKMLTDVKASVKAAEDKATAAKEAADKALKAAEEAAAGGGDAAAAKEAADKAQKTADKAVEDAKAVSDKATALEKELKELKVKVEAIGADNKKAIDEIKKEVADMSTKLMQTLGIGKRLTNVVLYPETYVMGVESVVLRPIVFGHNWSKDYVAPDENGNIKEWGAMCPCEDCEDPEVAPDCPVKYGEVIEGVTKDKKVFAARAYMMPTQVRYNLSPSNINVSSMDVENLEVTSHLAAFTRAGGVEDEGENPFTAKFVNLENGKMTVELNMNTKAFAKHYLPKMTTHDFGRFFNFLGYDDENGSTYNTPVLALQIPHSKELLAKDENATSDPYVTSDYVNLYVKPYFGLNIAKKRNDGGISYQRETLFSDYIEFGRKENKPDKAEIDECDQINAKGMADGVNVGTVADHRVIKLVEGMTLNLIDSVQSIGISGYGNCGGEALDITKYGLEWRFDLLDGEGEKIKFIAASNKTDQQEFIALSDEKKGTIKARVVGQDAAGAAVDRTPIVRVRIVDPANPDCFISQAFIKVLIVKEAPAQLADVFVGTYKAKAPNGCEGLVRQLTWKEVNENIYNGAEHKGGDLEELIKGLGISKEEFVKRYGEQPVAKPVEKSLGTVTWVLDTEVTGRSTYVPKWVVTICELNKACEKMDYTDVIPVKSRFKISPKDATRYPAVVIDFNGEFSKPSFKVTDKDLNVDYWNAAKTEVEHHSKSASPANSTNSANCTYSNNLNAIFKNPNPNYSLNLEGVDVNKYEYKFVSDVKQQYVADGIEIAVSPNGKELRATKKNAKGEVVGVAHQLIAKIIDHTATDKDSPVTQTVFGQDFLEYADTDLAKELLNKGWRHMWARIQLLVECDCGTTSGLQIPVTINGKDNFVVYFLRPINAKAQSPETFEDGVRFGLKGTILDVEKVVALEDWHKEQFSKVPTFYEYYGVETIKINPDMPVQWDSNGKVENIPSTLKVHWIPKTTKEAGSLGTETGVGNDYQGEGNYFTVDEILAGLTAGLDPANADDAKKIKAIKDEFNKLGEFKHGALTYYNNGTTVKNDFYLYVPLRIEYKWGVIVTETVKIQVKKTVVQEDKK